MKELTEQELRDFIAEKVMKWHKSSRGGIYRPADMMWKDGKNQSMFRADEFHPTADPAAAMLVLEKCVERLEFDRAYPAIQKYSDPDGFQGWQVSALYETRNQRTFSEVAETLPLAICRFAYELFNPRTP